MPTELMKSVINRLLALSLTGQCLLHSSSGIKTEIMGRP
jgi:hypothetical protein